MDEYTGEGSRSNENNIPSEGAAMQPMPGAFTYGASAATEPDYGPDDQWHTPPAPPQDEKPKKRHGGAKLWIGRAVTVVVVAAVAFGCGFAGTVAGHKSNTNQVVIQQSAGSTGGSGADAMALGAAGLTGEQVAESAGPTVVAITTEAMTTGNYWFGSQVTSGAGSGVVISEDGYIITNNHVVGTADSIKVQLYDGTTHDAQLVGTYQNGDIAVIKIDATGLKAATFGDSDAVKQGQTVYAIGNPEGRFSGSVTSGIISAIDRTISVSVSTSSDPYSYYGGYFGYSYGGQQTTVQLSVMQFDAAVSPGNSGGGLFNDQGELVGIVCAKSSDTDAEGLGFAINGNRALEIATSIITTGSYADESDTSGGSNVTPNTNKAMLGITAAYADEAKAAQYGLPGAGVYVASITEQSTADAGLAVNDRIISIDDVIVSALTDVTGYLADKAPGDQVTLSVERGGKMLSITVTLLENPNA